MIKVNRGPAPEIFTPKKSPALLERKKAVRHYSRTPLPVAAFKFTFYTNKKDKYKQMLINTFHGRCAYRECYVMAANRGDIEHFRPKGKYIRLDGTESRHGYYFLAAEWTNLYLSCTNCNQNTVFNIIDINDSGKIIRQAAGKMNQFALSEETRRRDRHNQNLDEEEPFRLLIDPCKDNPEDLLEFMDNGVLRPRREAGIEHEKAEYSIRVYVLQRDVLVKSRREKYLQVMDRVRSVDTLLGHVMEDTQAGIRSRRHEEDKAQLENDFMKLLDMLDFEKEPNEYLGLTRQYIHPFLDTYIQRLSGFLDFARGKPWYTPARGYFQTQTRALKKYFDRLAEYSSP